MVRRFQTKKKKRSIIVKPRDTPNDGISLIQTAYSSNTEETASYSPAPNPSVQLSTLSLQSTSANLKENPASKPKKLILRRPKTSESSGHDRKPGYRTSRLYSQVVSSTRRQQVNQPPLRDFKRPMSISTMLNSISLPSNTRQQQPLPLSAPHKTQSEAYEPSPFDPSHNRPIGKNCHCMFLKYIDDFNLIPKDILHSSDDKYFAIYDLYPKSMVHLLVLPRTHVEKLEDLSGEDGITIIKELQERGNRVISESLKLYPYLKFSMGFHIIPSMFQVHLHVISNDFCPGQKFGSMGCKLMGHHYNGFNTPYFLTPEMAIQRIQERGSIALSNEEKRYYRAIRNGPLKCNQCWAIYKNLDAKNFYSHLQDHLETRKKWG